jgi:hypothetical protein
MDLDEFIAETIVEIQQGVQSAIQKSRDREMNGVINPVWGDHTNVSDDNLREVNFDIAVTVTDRSSDQADARIKVMGIGLGGGLSEEFERSQVSRIQFSIPIVPPTTSVSGIDSKDT